MRSLMRLVSATGLTVMLGAQIPSSLVYSGLPSEPLARMEGDTVHVVLMDIAFPRPWAYRRSGDRGRTWSSPALPSNFGSGDIPLGALASSGSRVHLFTETSLLRSSDDGVSWSSMPNSTGLRVLASHAAGLLCHVVLGSISGPPGRVGYMRTLDGGATWSTVTWMSSTGSFGQMVVDGATVHLFWIEATTRYSRSVDGGTTWSAAIALGVSSGNAPRAAVSGSFVHLLRSGDLRAEYLRSADGGATWSTPVVITSSVDRHVGFAVDGRNIYVLLRGPVYGLSGLIVVRSNDDGATWAVGTIAVPHAVFDSAIQAKNGVACIAWSTITGNNRSIAVSRNAGATWQVSGGGGSIDAAWPRLALNPPFVAAAWMYRRYLGPALAWFPTYLDVSPDNGATWHLRQQYGNYATSGPAQFLQSDDACGFFWADGYTTNGFVPTDLHFGTIYGHERFGPSKPGTNGIAPRLTTSGSPQRGNSMTVTLTDALGGALALLSASVNGEANTPLGSCRLLLGAPTTALWGVTSGAPGAPGAGSLALPFTISPHPALHQHRITFQGFVLDANAAEGFASTAGLTMIVL